MNKRLNLKEIFHKSLIFSTQALAVGIISLSLMPSFANAQVQIRTCESIFPDNEIAFKEPRALTWAERMYSLRSIRMLYKFREIDSRFTIYYSEEEKAKFNVHLDRGLFINANGEAQTNQYPLNFVLDENYKMYTFTRSKNGRFVELASKHSSVTGGERVRFGGEVLFDNGRLTYISNRSGHYEPSETDLVAFLIYLNSEGVDLSKTQVEVFTGRERDSKRTKQLAHDFIARFIPGWVP